MPDAAVVCRINLWLTRVERALGRIPMIYTSAAWGSYFSREMSRYPLWVANYVGTPSVTCPRTPDAWDHWRFWQHAEDGSVRGLYANGDRDGGGAPALDDSDGGDGGPIAAGSDMNYFDGTMTDLTAFIAGTVSPGTVVDPPPLSDPPHVPTPDGGSPVDCSDGCCVADP
jgi:GH25 family lysozyme M1 (1,4-beta-N-acetylmuramidase)